MLSHFWTRLLLFFWAQRGNSSSVQRTLESAWNTQNIWRFYHDSINLAQKKVSQLKPFCESLLPVKAGDIVEFDEMWSFVFSKAQRVWIWIAICRRTRQVVAYHLGDRDLASFRQFYKKLPIGYANCLSRSDRLKAYKEITICGHKMCEKKEGQTNIVEAFNNVLRQRLPRLIRRGCSFSKSLQNHERVLRWFIQTYNEDMISRFGT